MTDEAIVAEAVAARMPPLQFAFGRNTFQVADGPLKDVSWAIVGYAGEEAINELSRFTLDVAALDEKALASPEDALLRCHAAFWTGGAREGRKRFGVVIEAARLADFEFNDAPRTLVRVTVAPRAWLLTRVRNTRVFQGKYPHEVVLEVLKAYGDLMRVDVRLTSAYPRRVYCVQYDETDWDFVTRIMAEEGIFFFFRDDPAFEPLEPPAESKDKDPLKTASDVIGGVASGAALVGKIAKKSVVGDWFTAGAGALGMANDLLKSPGEDPEDPAPKAFPRRRVGVGGPGEVLVLTDSAALYEGAPVDGAPGGAPGPVALRGFHPSGDAPAREDESVLAFTSERRVTSDDFDVRENDFRRPMLLLEGSAPTSSGARPDALGVYEHRGQYEVPEADNRLADIALQQLKAPSTTCQGMSLYAPLSAGQRVTIAAARSPSDDPRELAVTRVRHRFQSPELGVARVDAQPYYAPRADDPDAPYVNRFECVPSDVPARPPRPRRRIFTVSETGTVVGPKGDEVHVDRFGRIRVRFHWDRSERWYDDASCWMRVAQTWAGAGWGWQFIPRVGMEVVVTFLGGDPDRPVVTGCLYNGTHPTPEPLPDRRSRSGIRTQSTPEGGGFNELSFEDAKGTERVYLRAERDLDLLVRNSRTTSVVRDDTLTVDHDLTTSASNRRLDATGRDAVRLTGRHDVSATDGDRVARVGRNAVEHVQGDASSSASGVRVVESSRDDVRTVAGDQNVIVTGSQITAVGSAAKPSASVTYVNGDLHLTATGRVVIKAEGPDGKAGKSSGLRLECGDTALEVTPEGVRIRAKKVEVLADERVSTKVGPPGKQKVTSLLSNKRSVTYADEIALIDSKNAFVRVGDGELWLQGSKAIELMSPRVNHTAMTTPSPLTPSDDAKPSPNTPNVKLKLLYDWKESAKDKAKKKDRGDPQALAGVKFRVIAGGDVTEGTTDGSGVAEFYAAPEVKVAQVTAYASEKWPERFPEAAGPLTWVVHLVDEMPAEDKPAGLRARLRNLGYAASTALDAPADPDDAKRLDAQSREALKDFQRAVGVAVTGALDEATLAALKGRTDE
ncbi:MAG: type VI secretion system tip protein TssI/VgrG [Polyangiales bacterium]